MKTTTVPVIPNPMVRRDRIVVVVEVYGIHPTAVQIAPESKQVLHFPE
jgi:hypothetical protein